MASPTVLRQIDNDLRIVEGEVADLPELEATWPDETPMNKIDWHYEWWDVVGRYEALRQAYLTGEMLPQQAERYCALTSQLEASIPILERLGLPLPPAFQNRDMDHRR